jgi:DNA-binding transcriptional ArsR family regulator
LIIVDAVLTLEAGDWARIRFVRSRLWEADHAVRTLIWPEGRIHHRTWRETVDVPRVLARVPLLHALNPRRGITPDFFTPLDADFGSVEAELEAVAATDPAVVVTQVRASLESVPTRSRREVLEPLLRDPARLLAGVLAELRWTWDELLAPFWGQVGRLVEADVAYRTRRMARSGMASVVDDIDSRVVREGDSIRIVNCTESDRALLGDGFALMPSAFAWPAVILLVDAPGPITIVYPARGVAAMWERPPQPDGALVEVLGRTRALLLTDLGLPETTTALAARHGLSPAAVSAQLGRLRGAGLVAGARSGKEVRYRRTAVADMLVRASVEGLDFTVHDG